MEEKVMTKQKNVVTAVFLKAFFILLMSTWASFVVAADEDDSNYTGYVELKAFVANYGGTEELHFVKCEITIQVGSVATEQAVNNHISGIRNDILFLLMAQSQQSMGSVTAQNVLAKKAIMLVKQRLIEEEGEDVIDIDDLFFVSFVAQ
ncbi:MAG: flagellar FliL protein [Oceanospirillaceae bacterium]|jgi:flagellar FliL protein